MKDFLQLFSKNTLILAGVSVCGFDDPPHNPRAFILCLYSLAIAIHSLRLLGGGWLTGLSN